MRHNRLSSFLAKAREIVGTSPLAVITAEDGCELEATLRHHQAAGFATVVLLAPAEIALSPAVESGVHRIDHDVHADGALVDAVNAVIDAVPGVWLFYCHNAEFLFHPFCETRNVLELIAFQTEERRDAMLTYVVDLYAGDLTRFPDAVSMQDAHLDKSGYYALARPDPANHNHPKDRQLDFHGGLRWRFEEHIPPKRRKIDRICLFKTRPDLTLRPDFTLSDEEMNTYACKWHNNVTTALMSFRAAKALRTNPGSRFDIHTFLWRNSTPFDWHSQQLMDLGLMEPGQWF